MINGKLRTPEKQGVRPKWGFQTRTSRTERNAIDRHDDRLLVIKTLRGLKLYLYCSSSKSYFGTVPRVRRGGTNNGGSAMHCANCIYLNVHGHAV